MDNRTSPTLQQPYWLENDDDPHDVVLSTRFRLARNLRGFPFPHRCPIHLKYKVAQMVRRAVEHEFSHWRILVGSEVSPLLREVFFEKHLISAAVKNHPEGTLLILSPEARHTVMVNEEDHLRFQCLVPGFQVASSWQDIEAVESRLERWLSYAFHVQFGYLTSCLTNVGTGLRTSVMLHVPALVWTGTLPATLSTWPDQSIEFRGTFGEGSSLAEGLLQVSNKRTLGSDVATLSRQVFHSAEEMVKLERQARKELLERYTTKLVDSVHRSLALLSAARIMTSAEAHNHLSTVRLGACLGILPQFSTRDLLRLLVGMRPGHLQMEASRFLNPEERDQWRASYLRNQIQALMDKRTNG